MKPKNRLKKISLSTLYVHPLFIALLFLYSENFAQCPANPPGCVTNSISSQLQDTLYFCESITQVSVNTGITSPGVNFTWYKQDNTNTWQPIGNTSSGFNIATVPQKQEKYAVCWQLSNNGCYRSDEVVVAFKNFTNQLEREKEFELPNGETDVQLCDKVSKRPFGNNPNLGNPKYTYSWGSTVADNPNIKNPLITIPPVGKRVSMANFSPVLTITDVKYGCTSSKRISFNVYPAIAPVFVNIKPNFCEYNKDSIEVRLFLLNGYTVSNAQFQIGNYPPSNFTESDFVKIRSDFARPNNFNQGGRELLDPKTFIHSIKVPVTFPNDGDIQIRFNVENNIGCKADEITTTVKVLPSSPYIISLDPNYGKTNFCINDNRVGPLISIPAGSGTFSGMGILGDATNGYFFDPKTAGTGNHRITFELSSATGACAGGGSIIATVRPAPKPQLIGKVNVCLGSANVEYKDTAFFQNTSIIKTWSLENTNSNVINSVTSTPYGTKGDSIRLTFPDLFSEPNSIVRLIRNNDDAGCIASDTLEIKVNPSEKSPAPNGPTIGCLGGTTKLTYTKGSSSSTGYTYRWKVTQGTKVSASTDSSKVDINWYTNATAGTRTITVTDVSIKSDGTQCRIESVPLIVDFINPPLSITITQIGNTLNSSANNGNQWYKNNEPIPNATSQSYTVETSGTYKVRVNDGICPIQFSEPKEIIVNSIDYFTYNKGIKLYPNPAAELLNIESEINLDKLKLYQAQGQKLWEQPASSTISISHLSQGLYLLEIWDINGRRTILKFEKR